MSISASTPSRFATVLLLASALSISACSDSKNANEPIAGVSTLASVSAEPVSQAATSTESTTRTVPTAPSKVSLELVAGKAIRISWKASHGVEFYRVMEARNESSGYIQVSDDLPPLTESFNHSTALYFKVNARYIVQACNAIGCVSSNEKVVSGSLASDITHVNSSNANVDIDELGNIAGDDLGALITMGPMAILWL